MKKCDVLYIHSTRNPIGEDNMKFAVMPMGIIGILNNLKSKDIDILGLNYAIEKTLDSSFELLDALNNIEYKILMTDLHWYEHSFGAMYVAEQSKKAKPNTPVIIGGYTSTIYSEEIMRNFDCVDYIVTGDSDLPTEMLVERLLGRTSTDFRKIPNIWYRDDGIKCSGETWVQTDLDSIDFINTDFFEHEKLVPYLSTGGAKRVKSERWICIARGCKYNCAYCCGANKNMEALFKRCNVLTRSPEKVAQDFFELDSKGIWHIAPSHDFQMFGKAYYKSVFSEIRKRNIKPGLYLECFQLPTKDFIDEIEQTFDKKRTILVISPISGNEKIRFENGKKFSNNDFYEAVNYIISKGIPIQIYYTQNPIGETNEQYEDTVFQMTYLRQLYGLTKNNVFYQRVVIDPLAGMRDWNNVEVKYNTFMDYYNYCKNTTSDRAPTGYNDGGEVPLETKKKMYNTLFGISNEK
ncbi:MAG: hypothetical protein IJD37_07170 [Clostridia bacterium]|nr:hypothetical protein [Clostridia bacterium]